MLHQLQLGSASPYAPLISLLHHPAHPARALPLLVQSSGDCIEALDVYEQLFPALSDAEPALFSAAVHTRDDWLWAHCLVHRHTLRLPTTAAAAADGSPQHDYTLLPVAAMPAADVVWRGRVVLDEQRLSVLSDAATAAEVRVADEADADDDSRSVWTRGEYVVGSHPNVRVAASSLFPATFLAAQSSTHQALFGLFQSWDDEQAEAGHFYVGESGVGGGLLAWCRLLAMSAEEIAALMQQQQQQSSTATATGSSVVLDTDERTEGEEDAPLKPIAGEHDEEAAEHGEPDVGSAAEREEGGEAEDVVEEEEEEEEEEDEDEEEQRAAAEQSAMPRRNMRRLLLAGPTELQHLLLDWQRITTSGWRQLHSVLHAYVMEVEAAAVTEVEDEAAVVGVVDVSWERLQAVLQRQRLQVLRACTEWVKGQHAQ